MVTYQQNLTWIHWSGVSRDLFEITPLCNWSLLFPELKKSSSRKSDSVFESLFEPTILWSVQIDVKYFYFSNIPLPGYAWHFPPFCEFVARRRIVIKVGATEQYIQNIPTCYKFPIGNPCWIPTSVYNYQPILLNFFLIFHPIQSIQADLDPKDVSNKYIPADN